MLSLFGKSVARLRVSFSLIASAVLPFGLAFSAVPRLVQEDTWFQTDVFTLDTRGGESSLSSVFELDTRDPSRYGLSELFTLDTRGSYSNVTALFTLDTRDNDASYVPTNVHATAAQLTVALLEWDYQGTPSGFLVQRRQAEAEWEDAGYPADMARSFRDEGVLPGLFYEYRVAAIIRGGLSVFSDSAHIQMPSVPEPPDSLQVALTPGLDVSVTWKDMSRNETGFEIWRMTGADGMWTLLSASAQNASNFVDESVGEGLYYTYKIRSFNAWGASEFSEDVSIAVDSSGGGCGFKLTVDSASLWLTGIPATAGESLQVSQGAFLEGSVGALVQAPAGNPHPVRIVLGFRDLMGQAAGTPVEMVGFYSIPGCAGMLLTDAVPPGFRAPGYGSYTLWIEMFMEHVDPVEAFARQRHTQESPTRQRLLDVQVIPTAQDYFEARLGGVHAAVGDTVDLPIYLRTPGGEREIRFSVGFPTNLVLLDVTNGADEPQSRILVGELSDAYVGLSIATPLDNPMNDGDKHLANLRFSVAAPGSNILQFVDNPEARFIMASNLPITVLWHDGFIVAREAGLEGDVYPRPYGDGQVNDYDSRLAVMHALSLVDPPSGPSEFSRLDTSPVDQCGGHSIDMADAVAVSLFASGGYAQKPVCDPLAAFDADGARVFVKNSESWRSLTVESPPAVYRGEEIWVSVVLNAAGDEHGLQVALQYDPSLMTFIEMYPAASATNGLFLPNVENADKGLISFASILSESKTFISGSQTIAEIGFLVMEGTGIKTTSLSFVTTSNQTMASDLGADQLGLSVVSSPLVVYDNMMTAAPLPPGNASATALSGSSIMLVWDKVDWVDGYRLKRKLPRDSAWITIQSLGPQRISFVDGGLEPGTFCEYLLVSLNTLGQESVPVALSASTWSDIESWRYRHFGTISNAGVSADDGNPDGDNLPNRLEFELGMDPWAFDAPGFSVSLEEVFGSDLLPVITYMISSNAHNQFGFEASTRLVPQGNWSSVHLPFVSRTRLDGHDVTKVRLPEGWATTNSSYYLRLKAR